MIFTSDNWSGAAPEVLEALVRANQGACASYGADPLSARVEQRFCQLFERDVKVFMVATGGAANGLALSVLTPPYGIVFCHQQSHIHIDECAGPEFFTGGAKHIPLSGDAGKISDDTLAQALRHYPGQAPHHAPPKVLSVTQASECGTLYTQDELTALAETAHQHGLKVHMDGARFANAVAALGCSPAQASWRCGVDVLSFGATKNGCLAAEAVVFFNPEDAADFALKRKRAGHLWSKMRFIAAQFDAYLHDELWLRLAHQANTAAQRLAEGLSRLDAVDLAYPVEINEVFPVFPDGVADRLRERGVALANWVTPGDPAQGRMQRMVCSYRTTDDEVDRFLGTLQQVLGDLAA